jgi:hypothetical protein
MLVAAEIHLATGVGHACIGERADLPIRTEVGSVLGG